MCRSLPYLLAMSLKLGFMPASLYMFNSPIMFFSTVRAPPAMTTVLQAKRNPWIALVEAVKERWSNR